MGLIRKVASIATFGKVPWRSRSERRARAGAAFREATDELENSSWLQRRVENKAAAAFERRNGAEAELDALVRTSRRDRRRDRRARRPSRS